MAHKMYKNLERLPLLPGLCLRLGQISIISHGYDTTRLQKVVHWYFGVFLANNHRQGASIYDVHTEGVRLRWTHVDGGREGVKPHVDVHTEN